MHRSIGSLSLLVLLLVLLLWPVQAHEATAELSALREPAWLPSEAAADYLDLLNRRGASLWAQGVRVESLDGSVVYADHQGERTFNPASVIKVATSLAALERFGARHRFRTAFLIDGEIEPGGRLAGDLVLAGDGDPELETHDLRRMVRTLIRSGVRRIEGDLVIAGPLTVGNLYTRARVERHLNRTLRSMGLRIAGETRYGEVRGELVTERFSDPLRDILFHQNAHSSNTIADRVGEALGGPIAVERYLEKEVGIPAPDVTIERASGLGHNRMTPTGTVMMLRKLMRWLESSGMEPGELLPVAGIDPGTLRLRFNARSHRGAVVAKTGTLVATDDGISALAGILYTRDHGPLLFSILNTHGPVLQYRKFQDQFVKGLLEEYGGLPLADATAYRLGN